MIDLQYVSPCLAKWKEHHHLPQHHQRSLRRTFMDCGAADDSSWTQSSPTCLRATPPPRHTCPYGPLAQADASTDSEAEMSATRTCHGLLYLEFPMTSRVFWICSQMTCRSHAISPSGVQGRLCSSRPPLPMLSCACPRVRPLLPLAEIAWQIINSLAGSLSCRRRRRVAQGAPSSQMKRYSESK